MGPSCEQDTGDLATAARPYHTMNKIAAWWPFVHIFLTQQTFIEYLL